MNNFILCSHGSFAEGALDTLQMIAGECDNFKSICILPTSNLEKIKTELYTEVLKAPNKTVILCDILGGTPSNIAMPFLEDFPNLKIFSGFNVPLLLELALYDGEFNNIEDFIQEVFSRSFSQIKINNSLQSEDSEVDL